MVFYSGAYWLRKSLLLSIMEARPHNYDGHHFYRGSELEGVIRGHGDNRITRNNVSVNAK